MCVTSRRIFDKDTFLPPAARVTDTSNRWRLADVKVFSLERIICPGAQRGHGSALWCDSFTIWRYLCCFPVGIWCQLREDDARSGHFEVSLANLISGAQEIPSTFLTDCMCCDEKRI